MQTVYVDPDQTPHDAVSDLGVHCLPMSLLKDARLKRVTSTYYQPMTFFIPECGDGKCEDIEGETCEVCPADCGNCPLKAWQLGLIGLAAALLLGGVVGVLIVSHLKWYQVSSTFCCFFFFFFFFFFFAFFYLLECFWNVVYKNDARFLFFFCCFFLLFCCFFLHYLYVSYI